MLLGLSSLWLAASSHVCKWCSLEWFWKAIWMTRLVSMMWHFCVCCMGLDMDWLVKLLCDFCQYFFFNFFSLSFYNKKQQQKNSCFRCWVQTLPCNLSAGCLIHCRTRAAAPVYWRQAKKTEADLHFSFIALSKVGFKSTFNLMETHLVSLLFAFPTDSFFFFKLPFITIFFFIHALSLSLSHKHSRAHTARLQVAGC